MAKRAKVLQRAEVAIWPILSIHMWESKGLCSVAFAFLRSQLESISYELENALVAREAGLSRLFADSLKVLGFKGLES